MATPTANETITAQRGVMNLDTFEDVTLIKTATFVPAANPQEALERVGSDSQKFLDLINEGLRAEQRRQLQEDESGWMYENDDDEMVPFNGTAADKSAVNQLRLTLAKTVFGFSKDMTLEAKKAAKQSAMDMIRSTEAIKKGLEAAATKK